MEHITSPPNNRTATTTTKTTEQSPRVPSSLFPATQGMTMTPLLHQHSAIPHARPQRSEAHVNAASLLRPLPRMLAIPRVQRESPLLRTLAHSVG